jgi:hypothetical protein
MTFELSPQQTTMRDNARAYAEALQRQAAAIDRDALIPEDVRRAVKTMVTEDAFALVLVVEELATASAAVATMAAATDGASGPALSGLRGAVALERSARTQLVLASVALGIGRAATTAALAELRQSTATPSDVEKPHWVIADVATDLDAARLLTYKAARTGTDADIAIARLMATAAAARAVDAAVRVVGVAALAEGSMVERLSRDVRAVSVLMGSEEDQRAVAAEGLLPH